MLPTISLNPLFFTLTLHFLLWDSPPSHNGNKASRCIHLDTILAITMRVIESLPFHILSRVWSSVIHFHRCFLHNSCISREFLQQQSSFHAFQVRFHLEITPFIQSFHYCFLTYDYRKLMAQLILLLIFLKKHFS